jgi:hypothetical protein
MTPVAPSQLAASEELSLSSAEAGLRQLRELLASGQGGAARSFAAELLARYPDSEGVTEFARVLAPPVTRVLAGRKGRPLDRDYAWLREHGREYPGHWLAVLESELIAAAPDLKAVLAQLRDEPRGEQVLLHYEPHLDE